MQHNYAVRSEDVNVRAESDVNFVEYGNERRSYIYS
jgi:hypothetical protein